MLGSATLLRERVQLRLRWQDADVGPLPPAWGVRAAHIDGQTL